MIATIVLVALWCALFKANAFVYRSAMVQTGSIRQHLIQAGKLQEFIKLLPTLKKGTGRDELIDYIDNFYLSNITLGTPPQQFTIVPDTGSTDLWVVSVECKTAPCNQTAMGNYTKHRFNPGKSSTYRALGQNFSLYYGSGSCAGVLGIDKLSFAGLTFPKQVFGTANTIAPVFGYHPHDGIMGLGWPSLSSFRAAPPIQNILNQLDEPIFTVYMSRHLEPLMKVDGGVITYGGYDHENCDSQVNWVMLTSQTYWQFTVYGAQIGNYATNGWQQAISDTGTSYLMIPNYFFVHFAQQLNATYSFWYDGYVLSCSQQQNGPDIIINIGGIDYMIPSLQYVQKYDIGGGKSICMFAAFGSYSSGFGPSWILGDVFIRSYCNIHDVGNSRIGFAQAKQRTK